MSLLTGCANMSVVGTGSTESSSEVATVASTLDASATEEKSRILAEAKKLGITGAMRAIPPKKMSRIRAR